MYKTYIKDDDYLEAVKFKLSMNNYPCAIVGSDFRFIYANDAYRRVFFPENKSSEDASYKDLKFWFQDMVSSSEEQCRNVLLQMDTFAFLDCYLVDNEPLIYYKKKAPLFAPSGAVLGVDIQLVSMASVVGSINVLGRHAWYTRDDSTVGEFSDELIKSNLTRVQETYLFFILQGFSNSEIAECMEVSKSTVENTVRNITQIMERQTQQPIKNRVALKKSAFQLGYGYVLPRTLLNPHSIPLQNSLDDWVYVRTTK